MGAELETFNNVCFITETRIHIQQLFYLERLIYSQYQKCVHSRSVSERFMTINLDTFSLCSTFSLSVCFCFETLQAYIYMLGVRRGSGTHCRCNVIAKLRFIPTPSVA